MYIMWYLLLLFGFTASELTPNITIIWGVESWYLKYGTPILFDEKPFRIIVETSTYYAKDILTIECSYGVKNYPLISQRLAYVGNQYVLHVTKANRVMCKPWKCVIARKSTTVKYLEIAISAHIRLTEKQGGMLVNDRSIKLSMTDLTVSDYDALGIYYYRYGELAKITCYRTESYNLHELLLSVSDTQHQTRTDKHDVNLYLKLGDKNSPEHVDCAMINMFNPSDYYNIRLIFKPFTGEIDYPQFKVNGLSLSPSKNDSVHNYVFVYEYYHGEDLIVLSNLDPKRFPSMNCLGYNLPNHIMLDPVNNVTTQLRVNIPTRQLENSNVSVDCVVKQRNSSTLDVLISIKFIEDSMKFSPYITGIEWPNIIAKFDKYISPKKNEGTIYALQNSNDNMTTLNCYCNKNGFKWYYETEINSTLLTATATESQFNISRNEYVSSRTFQIPENFSKSTLECKLRTETSKVVLIEDKVPIKPTTQVTSPKKVGNTYGSTDAYPITTTDYSSTNMGAKIDDRGLFSGNKFLPILIGVITILIIILIITLISCICKRKKIPKTDTDINYENLPAHNEGSMPIPSQWDTNRLKNENIEDSYAKVIPKSQRVKLTEIYAEPLSNEYACYATAYNANSESPYAEIIPKPERNENVTSEPASNGGYAQITPKNIAKNQVLPTNGNYENGTKLRNRANSDKHKYANVFHIELYANAGPSDC